jgi:hypothetical protein
MTCAVTSLKTTVGSQAATSSNYTVSWPACSQATQYEIQEGARATMTNFTDGAEDEDAMYDNWYTAGTVKRDTGGKRSGSYSYAMHQYYAGQWGSSVQTLTLRSAFMVTTNTAVSYYLMSHLSKGYGYMACQISKDSGSTWKSLAVYSNGYINSWSPRTNNFAVLNSQGINAGDMCILRFVANYEYAFDDTNFPGCGYAIDDISITGIELSGYGGWSTLNSNVAATSYAISGKTNGVYAYRVRAYANSAWQGYGSEGETTVSLPPSAALVASKTGGGSITPAGAVVVAVGAWTNFQITATSPSNHIASIQTNGTHIAGSPYTGNAFLSTNFVWTNVVASGTITVAFAVNTYTLTVSSAYAGVLPGTESAAHGTVRTQQVNNSPVSGVGTQYVCVGATVAGNAYTLVSATNVTLTLTNAATLTWLWSTNYWLQSVATNGSLAPTSSWVTANSNLQVVATPSNYYAFSAWSGTTNGATIDSNRITVAMNMTRTLQAQFDAVLAASNVPQWWLAQYDQTNGGFSAAALLDPDGDGLPNWSEYVTGTDPTNAASTLAFTNSTAVSGGLMQYVWNTVTGRSYAVESCTNLAGALWTNTGGPFAGDNRARVWTNTPSGATQLFYRVRVTYP